MNKIKRIVISAMAFMLLFMLTGCGEIKKAETTVNSMFAAFKKLDFAEIEKYVDLEDIKVSDSDSELTGNVELFMKTLFGKLDYKIVSSEKADNNTVIVKTQITAIDMRPVMGDFIKNAMQYAFTNAFADAQSGKEDTDAKMEKMFIECATKPDLATVTNEVAIKVVKVDQSWEIQTDDLFTNAIFGGMLDVAKDMEKSFNNAE